VSPIGTKPTMQAVHLVSAIEGSADIGNCRVHVGF